MPRAEPSTSAWLSSSQVRREEPHRRQMHAAIREHVEDDGKPPRGAGDFDAVVGFALGHPEGIAAIDEQGRIALAQEHGSGVQFRQVGHDAGGVATLTSKEALQAGDQRRVGQVAEGTEDVVLHAGVVTPALDTRSPRPLPGARRHANGMELESRSPRARECFTARVRARESLSRMRRHCVSTGVWPNRDERAPHRKNSSAGMAAPRPITATECGATEHESPNGNDRAMETPYLPRMIAGETVGG